MIPEERPGRIGELAVLRLYDINRILTEADHQWPWKTCLFHKWRTDRKKTIVSIADLEELLSCNWTNRIWTYQEVILASEPVLVCGMSHVSWSKFTNAIVLLDRIADFPSSGQWTEILSSRARYRRTVEEVSLLMQTRILGHFLYMDLDVQVFLSFSSVAGVLVFSLSSVPIPSPVASTANYGLLILLLITAFGYCLPPNPRLPLYKPRSHNLSDHLERSLIKGLLNTICWRKAKDPRDMSFGILPILQHLSPELLLEVDYSARVPQVYTDLAILFLETYGDSNILALAAEAKCPGAASWVPDFSKKLQPISGSGIVAHSKRRLDPRYFPNQGTIENEDDPVYCQRRIRKNGYRSCTISAVSDFVDIRHIPTDMQEIGCTYNAKCIMQKYPSTPSRYYCCLYDVHGVLTEALVWIQAFRHQFPQLVGTIDAERLIDYEVAVLDVTNKGKPPQQLLKRLESSKLLDIHDTICQSFANSPNVNFVAEEPVTINLPGAYDALGSCMKLETYRFMGYVSGQQQSQIQHGDEIVSVSGMRGHVVYRPSENALIARLPADQSQMLVRFWERRRKALPKIVLEID
jgi:hypothetical protein